MAVPGIELMTWQVRTESAGIVANVGEIIIYKAVSYIENRDRADLLRLRAQAPMWYEGII